VHGEKKARVALQNGDYELPPAIDAAVAEFTSKRGREKTRWTAVSFPDRAAVLEAKLGNTGLFMSLLTIYADASEALQLPARRAHTRPGGPGATWLLAQGAHAWLLRRQRERTRAVSLTR
jgi:hypothetical protein